MWVRFSGYVGPSLAKLWGHSSSAKQRPTSLGNSADHKNLDAFEKRIFDFKQFCLIAYRSGGIILSG